MFTTEDNHCGLNTLHHWTDTRCDWRSNISSTTYIVHVHTYVRLYTHLSSQVHTHTYMYMCVCVHAYTHTLTHTHTHMHTHTYVYTHACTRATFPTTHHCSRACPHASPDHRLSSYPGEVYSLKQYTCTANTTQIPTTIVLSCFSNVIDWSSVTR